MTKKYLIEWYNQGNITYSGKERIERYINWTESNHSYTRSKYLIEQEKFETRIEAYPKDWCRIS